MPCRKNCGKPLRLQLRPRLLSGEWPNVTINEPYLWELEALSFPRAPQRVGQNYQLITWYGQEAISRSAHLPYLHTYATAMATALSQTKLFLASFLSTFSSENGSAVSYVGPCIHSTIITKRRSKCYQNIRNKIFKSRVFDDWFVRLIGYLN